MYLNPVLYMLEDEQQERRMKMRFQRFSSGRSFAKLLSILIFVAIAAPALSLAQTWDTGDPSFFEADWKDIFTNTDLICDVGDPLSTAVIVTSVTGPSFRFGAAPTTNPLIPANPASDGQIVCFERDRTTGFEVKRGLFTLIQARFDNGLEVHTCNRGASSCTDGGTPPPPDGSVTKRTTFIYKIKSGRQNNENLLYRLIPADSSTRNLFCASPDDTFCGANIGLDEHGKGTFTNLYYDGGGNGEAGSDYPARDVSNDEFNDLQNAEVFRFPINTEETADGLIDKPGALAWGPCSNGQFDLRVAVSCAFKINREVRATTVKAAVTGGVIVPIDLQSDNSTNSSLNMSQTSGTYPVAILGQPAPPGIPVGTINNLNFTVATSPNSSGVFVDGTQVPIVRFDLADVNGDSNNDLRMYFDKASFAAAMLNFMGGTCVNGSRVTVTLSGTLNDSQLTPWRGTDQVSLTNCP